MSEQKTVEWHRVGSAGDWAEDTGKQVILGARRIGVYRHAGAWFAIKDICPHAGVPLHRGPVEAGAVMCVGHGWLFDLATGQVKGMPNYSVATYQVRVSEAGDVEVGV
jgi:nitrite reductase/ring-hydroxylating ferredoxin subunit